MAETFAPSHQIGPPGWQPDEASSQAGFQIAPLAVTGAIPKATTAEIRRKILDDLPRQQALCCVKCTTGPAAGNWINVRAGQPEVVGSDEVDPEVTVCVFNDGTRLAPKHLKILPCRENLVRPIKIVDLSSKSAEGFSEGVFVQIRHIVHKKLRVGHELLFETLSPPDLERHTVFGSNSGQGYLPSSKWAPPRGAALRIERAAPLKEREAFSDFLHLYEVSDVVREYLETAAAGIVSSSSVNLFQAFASLQHNEDYQRMRLSAPQSTRLKLDLMQKDLPNFMPWEQTCRPLRLVSAATGDFIAEVRWGGAYLTPFSMAVDPATEACPINDAIPDHPDQRGPAIGVDDDNVRPGEMSASSAAGRVASGGSSQIMHTGLTTDSGTSTDVSRGSFGEVPRSSDTYFLPKHRALETSSNPLMISEFAEGSAQKMESSPVASFWDAVYLPSSRLSILSDRHPTSVPSYNIPDLDLATTWSCESLYRSRGLGLPLQSGPLGGSGDWMSSGSQELDELPGKIMSTYPRFDSEDTQLSRLRRWLNRTPHECLEKSSQPPDRPVIPLPPAFGSGFHLSIKFEQGDFVVFDTFPADSIDFSFTSPSLRRVSACKVPEPTMNPYSNPNILSEWAMDPSAHNGAHFLDPTFSQVDVVDGVWLKLVPGEEEHEAAFGDILRVGCLTFLIQRYNIGCGGLQGFRASMEDEEVVIHDLGISEEVPVSYFAVYDGHGGRSCASFLREELHLSLLHQISVLCSSLDTSDDCLRILYEGIYRSFIVTDRAFLKLQLKRMRALGSKNGPGGAAIVIVIIGNSIWCSNTGDARAVLCRNGHAIQLSLDHKPDRTDENERIYKAGGQVKNRRVLGRLAVSRAFGDIEYKNVATGQPALVIADPEIRFLTSITPADEFLLLACDGLFDVFTSTEIVQIIREKLAVSSSLQRPRATDEDNDSRNYDPDLQDPQKVIEEVIQDSIYRRLSRDNVSAILVWLNPIPKNTSAAKRRTFSM